MPQELVFTSAPQGLRPGSSGFCTVADTPDMTVSLRQQLELLSAYRHVEGVAKQDAPIAYSLLQVRAGASTHMVLSRVADAGLDYSRRSNMLAHHLVLDPQTQSNTDPTWLLNQPDLFRTDWNEEPRKLDHREMPSGESVCGQCPTWRELTTDPGWAGVLAASMDDKEYDQTAVIFRPSMDTKQLVLEALQLMPVWKQWQCTFSTYFTQLPPGVACRWRFVLEGSEEARAADRRAKTLVIDLCELSSPEVSTNDKRAIDGAYTWEARQGERRFETQVEPSTDSTQSVLSAIEPSTVAAPLVASTPTERRRTEKSQSSSRMMTLTCVFAVLAVLSFIVFVILRDHYNTLPVPLPSVAQPDAKRMQIEKQKELLQASIARWQEDLELQEKRLTQLRPRAAVVTEAIPDAVAKIEEFQRKLSRAQTEFNDAELPQDGKSIVEGVRTDAKSLHDLASNLQMALQKIQDDAAAIKTELDRISAASVAELEERVADARVEASRISNVVVQQKRSLQPGIDVAELAKTSLADMEQELRANEAIAMETAEARSQPFKNWDSAHFALPAARSGLSDNSETQINEIGRLNGSIPPRDVTLALLGDVLGSGKVFDLIDVPIVNAGLRSWSVVSKSRINADPVGTISYSDSGFQFSWTGNHGQDAEERQLCNSLIVFSVGDEKRQVTLRTPATAEALLTFSKHPLVSFEVSVQDYPRKCDVGVELSLQGFPLGTAEPTVRLVIPSDQGYMEAARLRQLAEEDDTEGELYVKRNRADTLRGDELSGIRADESCRWVRQTVDTRHFRLELLFKEISLTGSEPAPTRLALNARLTPNATFVPELDKKMANFRTFREAQSDIRARLNSDASELAGLPARFKALEVERRREAKSPKELKDNLDSLEKNFNKEKDKLEQSITSGTEKFEFLEAAFPLLQQLETDGQLPCRVFASYETHEIDLANFTGKSRIEKATTNPQ